MKSPAAVFFLVIICELFLTTAGADAFERGPAGPIYDGPELDYQPAILRMEPSGDLMIVFERLNTSTQYGDLYVAFSSDNGQSWTVPAPAIQGALNERHPALVQLSGGGYALFYLVDTTGGGAYRIYRATSPDGVAWTVQGALDLGWADAREINPSVIAEEDGSLTMAYQRLSGPCYTARSLDGGATWDGMKSQVSNGTAALPRIVKRESDGLYLCAFQTGSSSVDIWSKVTLDPYAWPVETDTLSTVVNSHDPQPLVLPGGVFLTLYAQQSASVFDLYYRTSIDGRTWSSPERVTSDTSHFDTQPHPLVHGQAGKVYLTWSHQESASPYVDHDVWFDQGLEIESALHLDTDRLSASTGGSIDMLLDAGAAMAGRAYLVLGTMSGTEPGIPLPGGSALLPLNWDSFTDVVLAKLNTPLFGGFLGILDGSGKAAALIQAPPLNPSKVGKVIHFAYLLGEPFDFASNPVGIVVVY